VSGEKLFNKLNRRYFIKWGAFSIVASILSSCKLSKSKSIKVTISGANSKTGHLLRNNNFPKPSKTVHVKTLIVGGGVSGLSAARWLEKSNDSDFLLLELDSKVGGNSIGGENDISKFAYGAHYLPIPNNNLTELLDFLEESKVIESYSENGLPVYNPYYLCFAPQERMLYKGYWYDNIPIKDGLKDTDEKEMQRFHHTCQVYTQTRGIDGKRAFDIPLENSSTDSVFLELDNLSIYDYLKNNNYQSEFLFWYVNYCSKDDFGSNIHNTSAWAVFHYFCSRNGKATNAQNNEMLTWPEGNYFLVRQMEKNLTSQINSNVLVYSVEENKDGVRCLGFNVKDNTSTEYLCENIIMATPQFVNKNLFKNNLSINWDEFCYNPWLVANVVISNKHLLKTNLPLSWDNVNYDSNSLGYINACHQHINDNNPKTVLTYYFNFSDRESKINRNEVYQKNAENWKKFIVDDLKQSHSAIEQAIEEIDVHLWGHGMISPQVGFRSSQARKTLKEGEGNIFFAHTDISGISIFEQAFYNGINAAKKILNKANG
jgi:protoporphyrinogen oxidase